MDERQGLSEQAEQVLRTEVDDGQIVTLTLNRPERRNALSSFLLEQLHGELEALRQRPVRVLILTGIGDKAFCAGADLKERRGMDETQVRQAVQRIRDVIQAVADLPMPVIAAINGVALGGGLELALAADLRLCAASAELGLTETRLAIIPGAGGTQRLPRLIGLAKAKELIFTGRRIDAATALELGLVNQVLPDSELASAALALAREIAANGPIAIRQAKFAIDQGITVDLPNGLTIEAMAYERVIPTKDRLEGLAAFAERRQPNYEGR
jgi:methylglutaconyl-CoA hydratase